MTNQEFQKLKSNIGKWIVHVRKGQGLSQRQLSEKSGVSTSAISRIECGSRMISVEGLVMLAFALGVSLDLLVSDFDSSH